eukprot:353040-Chlamydomonas_euryale.AAC.3
MDTISEAPAVAAADRSVEKYLARHGELDADEVFGPRPPGFCRGLWYQLRLAGCGCEFVDKKTKHEGDAESQAGEQDAGFQHVFSLRKRIWTTILFTLLAALIMSDQNALAPNVSSRARRTAAVECGVEWNLECPSPSPSSNPETSNPLRHPRPGGWKAGACVMIQAQMVLEVLK